MAVESTFVYDKSFQAAADLSSLQYYVVNSTGEGVCNLCISTSGGTNRAVGILQNDPTSGHAAIVRRLGESKAVVAGTIAIGAMLACTTAGTVTTASTGQYVIGHANSASTAASQVISIEVYNAGFINAGASA
jgi:uncharacterized protein DUF2190